MCFLVQTIYITDEDPFLPMHFPLTLPKVRILTLLTPLFAAVQLIQVSSV